RRPAAWWPRPGRGTCRHPRRPSSDRTRSWSITRRSPSTRPRRSRRWRCPAGALAAARLRPGARVTAQGVHFTWPLYAPGRFDNIRAAGQTIAVPGSGQVLGFLGAAALGAQQGTIQIHYTNGTTQLATLSFADWDSGSPAAG